MEGGEGDGLCARCSGGSVMEHGRCVLVHVCLFVCVLGRKAEDMRRNRGEKRQTDILLFSGRLFFCREVPKK